MNRRVVIICAVAFGLMGLGGSVFYQQQSTTKNQSPPSQSKPLHPLEIESIRNRDYVASQIKTEQILGDRGGYVDSIISYTSDGLKVYALQSVPDTPRPAGGYPVLIFNHGYIPPETYQTDGGDYQTIITHYARNGFVVIKPDYRGHGRSEGSADGGHYSPVYAYDILNLVESLKGYQLVDKNRIGTMGHSLGGHVSLRVAVVSRDVKATIVAAGVVGSFEDLFFKWPRLPGRSDVPRGAIRSNLENLLADKGDPRSNPEFWKSASAINYVDSVGGPFQVHHGTADESVPMVFSEHLRDALESKGKPVEFYEYVGGDHQFSGDARPLLLERTLAFLETHL